MSQPRQPEGTPAGGEFASRPHAEPAVALDVAPTVSPELAALHRARAATTAADEAHAKAAYAYLVSEAAQVWPTAVALRLDLDDDSDWRAEQVVDAEGNVLADGLEVASRFQMVVTEIQESGWAWKMIDDTGQDELANPDHDGFDSEHGVMRFDQPFQPVVDSEVSPAELVPGDTIVGDMGGTALITGEVGPSSAWPGFIRAEVEQGSLLLDPDVSLMVRRDL